MHSTAEDKARVFREAYLGSVEQEPIAILDVGSAIVEGQSRSNRDVMQNPLWTLHGLDIEAGLNVDTVIADPYDWKEISSGSFDVVTCSEVFEHAEYFWITILEIARVLKGNGVAFITSPGGGPRHRFPVDCWRFYDDAFPALARYAGMNLLEAQVQWVPAYRKGIQWRDSSAIMQKPVREGEEARLDAARAIIGKSLRASVPALHELDEVARPAAMLPTSAIPSLTGQNAFARREADLLASHSNIARKTRLVLRQLREIRRIIRTPMKDLHL